MWSDWDSVLLNSSCSRLFCCCLFLFISSQKCSLLLCFAVFLLLETSQLLLWRRLVATSKTVEMLKKNKTDAVFYKPTSFCFFCLFCFVCFCFVFVFYNKSKVRLSHQSVCGHKLTCYGSIKRLLLLLSLLLLFVMLAELIGCHGNLTPDCC